MKPQLSNLEAELLKHLQPIKDEYLWIALSGGVDSKVLLHACVGLRDSGLLKQVSAIHINHGIQAQSESWQQQCQQDCDTYQVELVTEKLKLSAKKNIEEVARQGRYSVFEKLLKPNQYLLMAHHQDDQAETLLYRLLRGCGLQGASSIPTRRKLGEGDLLRPLLTITRGEIETYAKQQGLTWVEDPSNTSMDYSRNFLRHQVLPKVKEKWPSYTKTLSRFTQVAAEQSILLEEIAREDFEQVQQTSELEKINSALEEDLVTLAIKPLKQLSLPRQKNLVYFWAKWQTQLSPSNQEIDQLLHQLDAAEKNSISINFAGAILRSFSQQLVLTKASQPDFLLEKIAWENINEALVLPNHLMITPKKILSSGLRLPCDDETVWVDARRGGEVCLPDYRDKKTPLKKIYQELNVPTWQREWLPLIYFNQELVAVPGVFVSKDYLTQEGLEGLVFDLVF